MIEFDGNEFDDLESFYDEVQAKICPGFEGFGRNLDAFNDVLRGGFGLFEYNEPIRLKWANSEKSKSNLSYAATELRLKSMRETAHPTNLASLEKRLELAEKSEGPTLFDEIIEIIKAHQNVQLELR